MKVFPSRLSTAAASAMILLLSLGCSSSSSPMSTSTPLAISPSEATDDDELLPQFVIDAVAVAMPGAVLIAAVREEEDGETQYEVLVETEEGNFEIDVATDGTIIEIDEASDEEWPISPSDLPPEVLAAVERTVPGGRITEAVRESVRGRVVYDVEVDVRGRKFDLEVAADGTVLDVDEGN